MRPKTAAQTCRKLVNAALHTGRKEEGSLEGLLASAPWQRADKQEPGQRSLMTLHPKGLEFPVVCSWAWRGSLSPLRSLEISLEEEGASATWVYREGRLFCPPRKGALGRHAAAGGAVGVSLELPRSDFQGDIPERCASIRREQRLDRLTRSDREGQPTGAAGCSRSPAMRCGGVAARPGAIWQINCRHAVGDGTDHPLFGSGEKISIAVKFEGPWGRDPRRAGTD